MTKLECVGHVQKRMGSRLCSLKKRMGKSKLGGEKVYIDGKGRLKKLLTIYKSIMEKLLEIIHGRHHILRQSRLKLCV